MRLPMHLIPSPHTGFESVACLTKGYLVSVAFENIKEQLPISEVCLSLSDPFSYSTTLEPHIGV